MAHARKVTESYAARAAQNPRSYYEDCLRVAQNLLAVSAFPLRDVADTIDPVSLLPKEPSEERVSTWELYTGLPFTAAFVTTAEDTAIMLCPACPGYIQTTVPWITEAGTGFAQKDFIATCMSCKSTFNREVGFPLRWS